MDAINKSIKELWGGSLSPELAITFLDDREEQLLTEQIKKYLKDCITSVRKSVFVEFYCIMQWRNAKSRLRFSLINPPHK